MSYVIENGELIASDKPVNALDIQKKTFNSQVNIKELVISGMTWFNI